MLICICQQNFHVVTTRRINSSFTTCTTALKKTKRWVHSMYTPAEEQTYIQKQEEDEIKLHKNLQECIRTTPNKGAAATEAQRMLDDFMGLRRQTSTIPLQFRSVLHKHSFRIVLDA